MVRRTKEESIRLAEALFSRGQFDGGLAHLKSAYPDAPEEAVRSAAFHLYNELPLALLNLSAELEASLREETLPNHGAVWHVIYHLYNWLQFVAIAPWARKDFMDELNEISEALGSDDKDFALSTLRRLLGRLKGESNPPEPDVGEGS